MRNQISKILYYVMVYFMFIVSDAQLMEELDVPVDDHGVGHFSSSSDSDEENRQNLSAVRSSLLGLEAKDQEVVKLLARIPFEESRKPSTANRVIGGCLSITSIIFCVVLVNFAYLALYIFQDGIHPVYDNSTCTYNNTTMYSTTTSPAFPGQSTANVPGWVADWSLTAGLAIIPIANGIVASVNDGGSLVIDEYRSARKWIRECCWSGSSSSDEYDRLSIQVEGQEEDSSRCACIPKRFKSLPYYVYSRPVAGWGAFSWCTYYASLIATMMINNYPDDPILGKFYAGTFATAAAVLAAYLFSRQTGVAGKNPLHELNDTQRDARIAVKVVREMMDKDEERSVEMMRLARLTNSGSVAQLEDLENAWADVWSQLDAELFRSYKLKEESRIWYATWGSLGIQALHFPLKLLAQGSQIFKLGWLFGFSPDVALKAAVSIPLVFSPLSCLASLRERSLVQYDLYQVPQYFSLPRSAYAVAIRGGNLEAAASNFFYLTVATWYFYQRDILYNYYCNQYFIPDFRVRAALAALFCVGPVWAVGRQFFDRQNERMISAAFASTCCLPDMLEETGPLTRGETKAWRQNMERNLYLLGKNKYDEPSKGQGEVSRLLEREVD